MGLLSGLWNAATWVWNQLQNVAPGFTNAVTNTVTNIVDTVVNAVQNTGSQSNTPAQPSTPTTPTGPSPEEIRQQRINQRGNQFDRDIGRLMRPELEEDARFYDEYPSDRILNSPASMADMILLAGQNSVVYGLMQMMRNERQTLNIVMQNAKSTVDGLCLLFADAHFDEEAAAEAANLWDQYVGGSSASWRPWMSSVGFDFVVSNSDGMFPSQEDPTPTPLQGPLGPNGEYFFANEQSEMESGSLSINTQFGTLVFINGMLDVERSSETLIAAGIPIEDLPSAIQIFNPNIAERLESIVPNSTENWVMDRSSLLLLTEFSGDESNNAYELSRVLPKPNGYSNIPQSAWMALIDNVDQSGHVNMRLWDNLNAELARRRRVTIDSNDSLYVEPPVAYTSTLESTLDVSGASGIRFSATTSRNRSVPQTPEWGLPSVPGITIINPLVVVSTLATPVYEVDSYNSGNMGFVNQPIGLGAGEPVQWGTHGETDPSMFKTFFSTPTSDDITYDVLLNIDILSRPRTYGDNEYLVIINTQQFATVVGYHTESPFQEDYRVSSWLSISDNRFEFQGMQSELMGDLRER